MSKSRFRSKEEAHIVRKLSSRGWKRIGRNGQNHERMVWPATGRSLCIPGTGPEHFYTKVLTTARRMEVASISKREPP